MKPKSKTGGRPRLGHAGKCRSATSQRQHAHAEASGLHSSRRAGTPLLGKVRVLKASTKNPRLTPLTPPLTDTVT